MNRRSFFFTATGSAATFALAGCTSLTPGSDSDDEPDEPTNTPEEAVEQFYTALSDGDREARAEVIHSDHPDESAVLELTTDDVEAFADAANFSVESVTVVEEDDEQAVVDITVHLKFDGETGVHSTGLVLQLEENMWKIIDSTTIERSGEVTDDVPELPEDVVVQFFEAIDVTDVDRMSQLVHTESPLREPGFFDEEQNARVDITVELAAPVEEDETQTEDDGRVQIYTILSTVIDSEDRMIQQNYIELRLEDGEWRIWNWTTIE